MLGMIQINLLPPEYRQPSGANMPLVLAAVLGVTIVLGMIFWWFTLSQEVTQLEGTLQTKQGEEQKLGPAQQQPKGTEQPQGKRHCQKLQAQKKEVQAIEKEIADLTARQDTIIDISQSKVMWSLKLEQLSDLMSKYKDVWVDSIRLLPGANPQLTMGCSALDYDLQRLASFRRALKEDPNFAYHFDGLKSDRATRRELDGYVNATEKASFQIRLPLTSTRIAKKKRSGP